MAYDVVLAGGSIGEIASAALQESLIGPTSKTRDSSWVGPVKGELAGLGAALLFAVALTVWRLRLNDLDGALVLSGGAAITLFALGLVVFAARR